MIQDQISLSLLELDTTQTYLHNPTMYVELLAMRYSIPMSWSTRPKQSRLRDLIARLRQIPIFVDRAKMNLVSAPEIWTKVAQEENAGNIDLLRNTIAKAMPADMRHDYDSAAKPALKALREPAGLS